MAKVTNPFDLLNSLEKSTGASSAAPKKSKPAATPSSSNGGGGETPTLSASQKKRRAKAQKQDKAHLGKAASDAADGDTNAPPDAADRSAFGTPAVGQEPTPTPVESEPKDIHVDNGTDDLSAYLNDVTGFYEQKEDENAGWRTVSSSSASGIPGVRTPHSTLTQPGTVSQPGLPIAQRDPPLDAPQSMPLAPSGLSQSAVATASAIPAGVAQAVSESSGGVSSQEQQMKDGLRDLEDAVRRSWRWGHVAQAQQWKQWVLQAQMPPLPDGKLAWKQVFLSSEALELTLKGCLDPPISQQHLPDLQALLGTFLANPEAAMAVAQVTLELAQVMKKEPLSAADAALLNSAQDALGACVTCLKGGLGGWAVQSVAASLEDDSVQSKLNALNIAAMSLENQVHHSDSANVPNGNTDVSNTPSVDNASCYKQLASIGEKRLNTLLGALAVPSFEEGGGREHQKSSQVQALERVRALTALILQRKRQGPVAAAGHPGDASLVPESSTGDAVSGVGGGGGGEGRKGVEEGEGDDDAAVEKRLQASLLASSAELEEARKQLEEAESAVLRLRGLFLEAESRTRDAQQRLDAIRFRQAGIQANPRASAAKPGAISAMEGAESASVLPLSEQHQLQCAQQLGTVHALETLLLRRPLPSDVGAEAIFESPEEATVWQTVAHAVTDHLRALASLLQTQLIQLQSAGQGLRFCQEKAQKIKDEMNSYRAMGRSQMAVSLAKPLERAEGLYKIRVKEVESVLNEADAVEAALHQPDLRTAVALLPMLPPVHLLLQQIGTTLHQIRKEHAALMEAPAGASATITSPLGTASKSSTHPAGTRPAHQHRTSGPPQANRRHEPQNRSVGGGRGVGGERGSRGRGSGSGSGRVSESAASAGGGITSGHEVQHAQVNGGKGDLHTKKLAFEAPPKSVWQKPPNAVTPSTEE